MFLAGGNSSSDRCLLDMARIAFIVHSAGPESEHFSEEEKMKALAPSENWLLFESE